MVKKIGALGLMLTLTVFLNGQTNVDKLLADFIKSDWKEVNQAKEKLENLQKKSIPKIISILNKEGDVKLVNTGSLIYPGAKKFYGHGKIVDYDIDNLSIRAGWLLEDLTFQNFGFSGYHLPKDEMKRHIKITFPSYYNNANNRKEIESSSEEDLKNIIKSLSIKKAKEWWKKEGDDWNRLIGLANALRSYDEKRQVKALFYIRNGRTKCDGLTKDYYIDNLSKEIVRLSSSGTKRVSEHARLILYDTGFSWLDLKK